MLNILNVHQVEAVDEREEAVANGDEHNQSETAVDPADQLAHQGVLVLPDCESV